MENYRPEISFARDALSVCGPDAAVEHGQVIAHYKLRCTSEQVGAIASALCFEHTVELSPSLIGAGYLATEIAGRTGDVSQIDATTFACEIRYPAAAASGGLTTLLTLVMGNAGFFPEVELTGLDLPESLQKAFLGPKFGIEGLRQNLGRLEGPITGTALKPLGASATELAAIAGQMAEGGIEILKEDDGISTQAYAPFAERVARCSAAVREAADRSNNTCLYFPNITGPQETLIDRAMFAQDAGAGGVELLPGPMGLDSVRMLAELPDLKIPVAVHSAWTGGMCRPPNPALSYAVAFGLLPRLAGADISIMPGFGGRFGLPKNACRETADILGSPIGGTSSTLPMVGGGLTFDRIDEYVSLYGNDVILLISGALFEADGTLIENCREFVRRTRLATRNLKYATGDSRREG